MTPATYGTGANDPNPSGGRPLLHAVANPPPRYSRTGKNTWRAACGARVNKLYWPERWGAAAAVRVGGKVCRRCVEVAR